MDTASLIPPPTIPQDDQVFGFMHIAMNGHWKSVVDEQFYKLSTSGLYERTNRIFVTLLGPSPSQFLYRCPKVEIVHTSPNFEDYEFPTLNFMHTFAKEHDGLAYYIHTKGVFNNSPNTQMWRRMMEHFVILRFRDCISALGNCDLCGVDWLEKPWPHFTGNFWWARLSFARTLPPPTTLPMIPFLNHTKRHVCERWIGSGQGRVFNLFTSRVTDHNAYPTPQELYMKPDEKIPMRLCRDDRTTPKVSQYSDISTWPIVGFMHVAMKNHWQQILTEQFLKMKASGLWDKTDKLYVGLLGPEPETFPFREAKIHIACTASEFEAAEIPTLAYLHRYCQTNQCLAYYLHTKGVFRIGPGQEEWRRAMEHFVILRHEDCLAALRTHDTCGINFLNTGWCQIYAGNFWWARSDYIKTLPNILALDPLPALEPTPRHVAERWIGENEEMRPACLHNTRRDHYANQPYPRSCYARLREVHLNQAMRPSAWTGLENRFQDLLEPIGEIRLVVELGVEYGFSAFCLAAAVPSAIVIGVDPYERLAEDEVRRLRSIGSRGILGKNSAEQWVQRHRRAFPNFVLLRTTSQEAAKIVLGPIDVLHIDCVHTFTDVKRDFETWEPLLRPGGCVLFHDTRSFPQDIGKFFEELPGRKAEIPDHFGLGAWYKSPEFDPPK